MNSTYIIGEIGQNHNGSVDLAKLLIDIVSRPVVDKLFGEKLKGINAIKLTKRDLSEELSVSQLNQAYCSPNSFGKTYGEHREVLELSYKDHQELYHYAKSKQLDVIETLCSIKALKILKYFQPDKLKVASRDLTNLPLLHALSETGIPIILSTGMGGKVELDNALNIITKSHSNVSILHCVSEYPTQYKNVNLNTIRYLIENYSNYIIGYSDHTIGIATPVSAVALGARIIEKHITINRGMKGSDQAGSLEGEGLWRMVRDIRNIEFSLGENSLFICKSTMAAKCKLERSIASTKTLEKGHIITENDIHLLSPGDGFKWSERNNIVGHKLIKRVEANEIIHKEFI